VILVYPKISFGRKEDYIALVFLLVWLYGFFRGLLNGNNRQYVVANFAGMICYFFYFVLLAFKCNLKILTKLLFLSGFILSLIVILRMVFFVLGVTIPFFKDIDIYLSSTGQSRVYFSNIAITYSLFGSSFYALLFPFNLKTSSFLYRRGVAFLNFVLTAIVIFFITSSKGFLLGGLAILGLIIFASYIRDLLIVKFNKGVFGVILIVILLFSFLVYFGYFTIIENMFSAQDISNKMRYEQLHFILDDLTFFGKGLGATIDGLVRSEDAPYGYELTYLNLVHKFGFMSLFLFIGWIYMFIVSMRFIFMKKQTLYAIVALASLGYLFPSLGNPLLMHPSLVVLNCLTLYFLRVIRNG
jgi:hypothetical protein